MQSAFGIEHGEIAKFAVRVPKPAAPGVRGKLKRVKSTAQLAGVKAAHKVADKNMLYTAALGRAHT